MSGGLEVMLLGPTAVTIGGRPVAVAGAPQRTVLTRLALSPQRTVTDVALVDALWPGGAPANADGNLKSYVSRLRRALGADAVAREPRGYRLDVDPERVDIVRFERLIDRALAEVAADPATGAGRFAEALALWRGEPFGDIADPLAFAPERARLTVLRERAHAAWLGARVDSGDAEGALADLQQAVAADPTAEAVHLVLIRALYVVGRTAEALRVAADLRSRQVDRTGLDPSPALADLERRVLADDPDLRPRVRADREPAAAASRLAPADRFVGRQRELDDLATAATERRVVTVVGAGGAGKTRLVQELVDRGTIGQVVVVELASVSTDDDLPGRVASALGLKVAADGVASAVGDLLAHRDLTLVLDNCEHVIDGTRALVHVLLATGPGVRVLATSRVRLGVAGELVIRLGALAVADQAELFCDRAALLRPGFEPREDERPLVGSICRQLDGLPLALELAARREAVFGLAQLDAQLASGLDVIEPGDDEDGSGVVSAVGWSYRLLGPDARSLFDRLAVCRGGFTLEALTDVSTPATRNPVAALAELVDASLVEVDLAADPPRYRLLEVMRRVALGHLDDAELADARRGHRRWMRGHLERCAELQSGRSPDATGLLRREVANLIAALVVHDENDRAEVGELAVLAGLLVSDDPHLEVSDQLRRLEPWTHQGDEAAALCAIGCGAAAWLRGDTRLALGLLDGAIATLPPGHPHRWVGYFYRVPNAMFMGDEASVEDDTRALLDDPASPPWGRATTVSCAALINLYRGQRERADEWMDRHEALLESVREIEPFVAFTRAELASTHDPDAALDWFDRAYRASDERNLTYGREIAAVGRASVLVRLGRNREAAAACATTVTTTSRIGMWPQAWTTLRLAAELLGAVGEPATAASILTAAAHDPLAPEVLEIDRSRHAALWDAVGHQLTEEEVLAARRLGDRLDRPQLVAHVVEVLARHA